ncbi:PREDICTED: luciferin 4-monooxygenase-like [Wasmannia auropunctata]|uniref:luciferin 4-monooxygenase-like n=1 Tax=Wasmannia auropunctata TaxID=64793 RepID=UPI0005EEAB78|nr:PREDICTED: luciferin 4-monooxygenase-like [Wasmannia auropunctata]
MALTDKNKVQESTFKGRIKDDILLGPEYPVHRDSVNVAETILKTLKSKPDCIGQNLDAIIVLLGIMYINGKCNTWDHELSLTTARYFLSLTSPKLIFTIPLSAVSLTKAAKELKMDVKIVVLGKLDGYESVDDILKGHDSREVAEFKCTPISNPDEVGLIVLSSGTTGMPKATEISHTSIHNRMLPVKVAEMKGHVCMFTPALRWLYGVRLAFKTILACSTRIVVPDCDRIIAPDGVTDDNECDMYCKFIEKYQVTWFCTDPFILVQMIKTDILEKFRLSSLKVIITSGSIFQNQYQETLRKKLPQIGRAHYY